jgi:uncharacterized protein (TIGR00288 family)
MKYIVLMDGGFVKHKFSQAFGRDPSALDIKEFSTKITLYNKLDDILIRIYYYDSPPLTTQLKKPVSGAVVDLSKTPTFLANRQRLEALKRTEHFAVREGRLTMNGWKLKQSAIGKAAVDLNDSDFSPDIQQKGVDMKIGLDIAWISFNKIAERILVVTGDSDFIPAIKLARRNGIQVYLFTLAHGVTQELTEHSDRLIITAIDSLSQETGN